MMLYSLQLILKRNWDGKIQGDTAPSGAYVFQVYAEGQEGSSVNTFR